MFNPVSFHDNAANRWKRAAEWAKQRTRRFGLVRLISFLVAVVSLIALFGENPTWLQITFAALGVLSIIVFTVFVAASARMRRYHARAEQREGLAQESLARMARRWSELPDDPGPELPDSHLYARDVDVVGPRSLFRWLNTTITQPGRSLLTEWLSQPATPAEIRRRQAAARLLAERPGVRHRILAEGRRVELKDIDFQPFEAWLAGESLFKGRGWLRFVPFVLLPLIYALIAVWILPIDVVPVEWAWLILLGIVSLGVAQPLRKTSQRLQSVGNAMDALSAITALMPILPKGDPWLDETLAPLRDGETAPGPALERTSRILSLLQVNANPILGFLLNTLATWDLIMLGRLERFRLTLQPHFQSWLSSLAKLDAMLALAELRFNEPDFCEPEVDPRHQGLRLEAAAHPLLDPARRKANALVHEQPGRTILITGSNMSGKSTFLRTVGVTVVLAQAGAVVCARSCQLHPMTLAAGIRFQDSLDEGISYFYAEVRRMKAVLAHVESQAPGETLVLLDEIFKGTNTRERLIASRGVIGRLNGAGALSMVTTHDLDLVDMADRDPERVENAHFQEQIQAGEMTFDYTLREGPVTSSNALKLMELEGIHIPETTAD